MSLESWKQEYYPVPANETDKSDAVAHSLRKWLGLRPEVLAAHSLVMFGCRLCEKDNLGTGLYIDADSCALCHHYSPDSVYAEDDDTECERCPLYKARGGHVCHVDDVAAGETETPFRAFTRTDNPEPMIRWLQVTQQREAQNTSHAAPEGPTDHATWARENPHKAAALDAALQNWDPLIHGGTPAPHNAPAAAPKPARPAIGGLSHEAPAKPGILDSTD